MEHRQLLSLWPEVTLHDEGLLLSVPTLMDELEPECSIEGDCRYRRRYSQDIHSVFSGERFNPLHQLSSNPAALELRQDEHHPDGLSIKATGSDDATIVGGDEHLPLRHESLNRRRREAEFDVGDNRCGIFLGARTSQCPDDELRNLIGVIFRCMANFDALGCHAEHHFIRCRKLRHELTCWRRSAEVPVLLSRHPPGARFARQPCCLLQPRPKLRTTRSTDGKSPRRKA